MKPFLSHTWARLLVFGLLLVLLALVWPTSVWAHGPADGGAKTDDINELFTVIFWMSVPVFLLVEGLIVYAIYTSIRRRNDEGEPEQVEGNHVLEIGWTVASFVIIAVVFVLSYRFMTTQYEAEADTKDVIPNLTVHVTGYMFDWDYDYFLNEGKNPEDDIGVRTRTKLTIPADRNVLLEITSRDVQHSFWVPDLAGKVDAIPGYTNTMWLNIDEPGLYHGNCAEFCGTAHWKMLIDVEVLEPAVFEEWLAAQRAAAAEFVSIGTDMVSPLPLGDALRGAGVFDQLNCGTCHRPEGGNFPSLEIIRRDMDNREGYASADDYLRESILMPGAYVADGYPNIMPPNYGDQLDAQMLADLIEYLKTVGE